MTVHRLDVGHSVSDVTGWAISRVILTVIGVLAVGAMSAPAAAATLVPFQQEDKAKCKGDPAFNCVCTFPDVGKVEIRHVSVSGKLPVGTRVLFVRAETSGSIFEEGLGSPHIAQIREVFLASGQYVTASQSLLAYSNNSPWVRLLFEGETPDGKQIACSWFGYKVVP